MLLVCLLLLICCKASVHSPGDRVALPSDTGFFSTQSQRAVGGVHLAHFNDNSIDLHKKPVTRGPGSKLVQIKVDHHLICRKVFGTTTSGDTEKGGHLVAALSKLTQELGKAFHFLCGSKQPG